MSSIPHLTDAVETLLRASDDPLPRAVLTIIISTDQV